MYRLVVCFVLLLGWFSAPAWAGPVNVNTASESELDSLPGICPSKAAAIIAHRDSNGPFVSLSDLDAVKGIGPATLESLAPLVIFSEDGQPPVAAAPSTDGGGTADAATSAPAASGGRININTASQSQLEGLPGIGPSKASAIIDHREKIGAFASCDSLSSVTGIGDATVANLAGNCAVE